jgi:hypothetical protein
MAGHHALIYGASGISGWAITNALLGNDKHASQFSKITALTNRPLTREQALWPQNDKLQIVSGLDLLTEKGQNGLEQEMRERIKDVESVSHVYFFCALVLSKHTNRV